MATSVFLEVVVRSLKNEYNSRLKQILVPINIDLRKEYTHAMRQNPII